MEEIFTVTSKFRQQSAETPILRLSDVIDKSFCLLSGNISEKDPERDEWIALKGFPEAMVLLEQYTDDVLSWVRPYSVVEGLSEQEKEVLPDSLKRITGGYYKCSKLGPGPFLYLNVEYTREKLLALFNELRPYCLAQRGKMNQAGEVVLQEVASVHNEWNLVPVMFLLPWLRRSYPAMTVTLYQLTRESSRYAQIIGPELHLGFQLHTAAVAEMLLPLMQARVEVEQGLASWWKDDEVRELLNDREKRLYGL